jgi:hypothetical protein
MGELRKAAWHIDRWTDETGGEMEIIDHGHCVEVLSLHGDSIRMAAGDALRVYAGLEKWLAGLPPDDLAPVGSSPAAAGAA